MFRSARIKLTFWYLLIIMLISISFSVVIYKMLSNEMDRFTRVQRLRIERRLHEGDFLIPELRPDNSLPPSVVMDPDLLSEIKSRLIMMLVLINGSILVFSGGFGYLLAGRTLKPIKEMLLEQNRFISDSSHELRTPLTSLKSALEVNLRNKNLTIRDSKNLIVESIDEVNKLQSLTDDLLQLAQYQKPNGYGKFEKIQVLQAVNDAIRNVDPIRKKKNIIIDNKVENQEIEGNRYGLTELIVILLENALKYSPEKTKITIKTQPKEDWMGISVSDQGIGIARKDLPRIFDRFYRSDAARTKTEFQGYGLGLAIAKKIADIHHGEITVKSRQGAGSIFTVFLPVKQNTGASSLSIFS